MVMGNPRQKPMLAGNPKLPRTSNLNDGAKPKPPPSLTILHHRYNTKPRLSPHTTRPTLEPYKDPE